jgi:aminoglycoside phosphotransferase (APT) family kinase protein
MEANQIQSYLAALPGWEQSRVGDLALIGQGWESKIYGFTVTLPDSTLDLALRMYTGDDGPDKALRESGGMPQLRTVGYPVPQILLFELNPAPLGLPFVVMERITGSDLWSEMHSHPEERSDYERVLGDLLVELHRLEWRPFLAEGDPVPRQSHDVMRRNLGLWSEVVTAVPAAGFAEALNWFSARLDDVAPLQPAVTHNDFHPGNILITPEGSVFVIDWTALAVSDPRLDLAWTLMLMELGDGAEPRQRILERYAAELSIDDLDYFMAAACVKRLYSLVVSLTHGPEVLGMRPGAAVEMQHQLAGAAGIYSQFTTITGHRLPSFEALR